MWIKMIRIQIFNYVHSLEFELKHFFCKKNNNFLLFYDFLFAYFNIPKIIPATGMHGTVAHQWMSANNYNCRCQRHSKEQKGKNPITCFIKYPAGIKNLE